MKLLRDSCRTRFRAPPRWWFTMWVAIAAWLLTGPGIGLAQETAEPADDTEEPVQWTHEPGDLLRAMPFDRITLRDKDKTVMDVEPISPRPVVLEEMKATDVLAFNLFSDATVVREVRWGIVESIHYFEDMVIEEVDRMLQDQNFDRAFELLTMLKLRWPNWPNLPGVTARYLMTEGKYRLSLKHYKRALDLLMRLRALDPEFPQLVDVFGDLFNAAMYISYEGGHYSRSRALLRQFKSLYPEHPVAQQWTQRHERFAAHKLEEAQIAKVQGKLREAFHLARHAVYILPSAPGAGAFYRTVAQQFPYVVVGVEQLPQDLGPWGGDSDAQRRSARLLYLPLLDLERLSEEGTFYDRLAKFAGFDVGPPTRVTLKLQGSSAWSADGKPLTAIDVSRSLTARADPRYACYDPRWAGLLQRVEVQSLTELTVELSRRPVAPKAWFVFNVAPAQWLRDGEVRRHNLDAVSPPTCGPFMATEKDKGRVVFLANPHFRPLGDQPAADPFLAELVEKRYANADAALRALVEGEVSVLARVRPVDLPKIKEHADLRIGRYEAPTVHFLAFDYRKRMLANRLLRRAIAMAIDRRRILEEVILHAPAEGGNRLVSAPFPADCYAYNKQVAPWPYEPRMARIWVVAAQKELGIGLDALDLAYPDGELTRRICIRIQKDLRRVGLTVVLKPVPPGKLQRDVDSGKQFDLAYRTFKMRTSVIHPDGLFCPSTRSPRWGPSLANCASPWLRKRLMLLYQRTDWDATRDDLKAIHRIAHQDTAVVPLWQVVDYFAYHKSVAGIGKMPMDLYQNVVSWKIEPWFPKDPD